MDVETSYEEVAASAGPIRIAVTKPGRASKSPAVLFYSDIFQLTGPHLRLAAIVAERGYCVIAPELYGRFEPAGTVLDFERDRQRALDDAGKLAVADVDADRRALLDHIASRADVDPLQIFVAGFCFGGHLAFRAAFEPEVRATACFYPTTIHASKLGGSPNVDTLERVGEIRAPLLLVWGSRDPHIPAEGRATIEAALDQAGIRYRTLVCEAEHAFMRDEGPRFDPLSTERALAAMLDMFDRARPDR